MFYSKRPGLLRRINGRVSTRTDVTTEGHSLLESIYGGYLDKSYYTQDSLGSVIGTFNDKGRIDEKYTYDSFGRVTEGRFDNVNRLGYNGKMIDPFTGNYDYGFRDYSPVSMRFTTVDPIRSGSNWYSYVSNDPINKIDPFGLQESDNKPEDRTNFGFDQIYPEYPNDWSNYDYEFVESEIHDDEDYGVAVVVDTGTGIHLENGTDPPFIDPDTGGDSGIDIIVVELTITTTNGETITETFVTTDDKDIFIVPTDEEVISGDATIDFYDIDEDITITHQLGFD
ncbi:MAG: RHS repeat-associated core domain-containing protein [Spirochaetaceae bacterium]|nr:RHS repeat-associated core domain-containing protein [Spirochaetaceae bacterium]